MQRQHRVVRALLSAILPTDTDDIPTSQRDGRVIRGLPGNDQITARLWLFGDEGNDVTPGTDPSVGRFRGFATDGWIITSNSTNALVEGGTGAHLIEVTADSQSQSLVTLSFASSKNAVCLFVDANGTGYDTAGDART